MKILILGGTGFLGPEIVEAATRNKHTITLFNRGKTHKSLFPDVEKLEGDRDKNDYKSLEGRTWDACIDTSANIASWMRESCAALKGKVGQYLYTSTISVYPQNSFSKPNKPETDPTEPWPAGANEKSHDLQLYGPQKARCEQICMETFGDRATIIRPGLIVGPGDYSDRFTYWPLRCDRGGEILAPGNPTDLVQYIDTHDLGEFCVKMVEDGHGGVYNATGPYVPSTISQLIYGCLSIVSNDGHLTWVPEDFLTAQNVGAWMDMPVWIGSSPEMIGFSQVSIDKALARGLKFRPLAETAKDTLDWAKKRPKDYKMRAGVTPQREAEVLKAWHEKHPTTAPATQPSR